MLPSLQNFVDLLMFGAPRQLMMENDVVQHGAYKISGGAPATHMGKIKYPQCKKGVWPPSNWEPSIADRSAQLPDVRLKLEFVYGYDGMQATSPNVFYAMTGEVVYFAAAVGIVYDKSSQTQRFFLGHDDDILCMVRILFLSSWGWWIEFTLPSFCTGYASRSEDCRHRSNWEGSGCDRLGQR